MKTESTQANVKTVVMMPRYVSLVIVISTFSCSQHESPISPRMQGSELGATNGVILSRETWTPIPNVDNSNWPLFSGPASSAPRYLTGDFDGDGRTDIARFDTGDPASVYVGLAAEPKFTSSGPWTRWWLPDRSIHILTGDFNGDGKSDILKIDNGIPVEIGNVWVQTSNGSGFDPWAPWDSVWMDPTLHVLVGDFNGDGKTDFVKFDNGPGAGIWTRISNGTGFDPSDYWGIWDGDDSVQVVTGDFDGDGRTDIAWFENAPSSRIMVGRSTGTSFVISPWGNWPSGSQPVSLTSHILVGDFDGDHKSDVVKLDNGSSGAVWVGLSNGAGAFSFGVWTRWAMGPSTQVVAGDFDGDGKADILKSDHGTNSGIWVAISNGAGAFRPERWESWNLDPSARLLVGDFNADRSADVVRVNPNASMEMRFGKSSCPRSTGFTFLPGHRYGLCYQTDPGTAPVSSVWSGEALKYSLLQPMMRPVILKADDLTSFDWSTLSNGLGSGWMRYMKRLAELHIAGSAGVVARDMHTMPLATANCLGSLDQAQMELWNHGFDHCPHNPPHADSGPHWICNSPRVNPALPLVEFYNSTPQFQREHLALAQSTIRDVFGITMHTFGAPSNAIDETAANVLDQETDILVSVYGGGRPARLVLGLHEVQMEVDNGRGFKIVPLAVFRSSYSSPQRCLQHSAIDDLGNCAPGAEGPFTPVVLQFHPQGGTYEVSDWHNLEDTINYLMADGRAFVTPLSYRTWLRSQNWLVLTKTTPTWYTLDMTQAVGSIPLTFTVAPDSVVDLETGAACP